MVSFGFLIAGYELDPSILDTSNEFYAHYTLSRGRGSKKDISSRAALSLYILRRLDSCTTLDLVHNFGPSFKVWNLVHKADLGAEV